MARKLPTEDSPEKIKRIHVLKYSGEERAMLSADAIWLCHSKPGVSPEGDGGGYFRSRSSFVWVKAGNDGVWEQTSWRSIRRAMDHVLIKRAGNAIAAVELLKQGEFQIEAVLEEISMSKSKSQP